MRQPKQPVNPVPTLTETELRALVGACEGITFRDRRDMALLRLLIDCGLRRTGWPPYASRIWTWNRPL